MRVIAVLLILLNLAYLAWERGWLGERPVEPPAPAGPPPFRQAEQKLMLLKELPLDQLALMEEIMASRARMSDARTRLAGAEQEIAGVQQQLEANAPPVPPPAIPWCASAGAFADEGAATAFIAELEALGGHGVVVNREEPVSSTWWVHIPPLPSEADARVLLDELQARNIDSYYMRSGELAGGISLGVFSREESAKTAQRQLETRGYTTSVREIFRMGTRAYVDLALPDTALLTTPEWTAFMASAADLPVAEKACEDVAPQIRFP